MRVYINGNECSYCEPKESLLIDTTIRIGQHNNRYVQWAGLVKEVNTFKRAITPDEIERIMHWGQVTTSARTYARSNEQPLADTAQPHNYLGYIVVGAVVMVVFSLAFLHRKKAAAGYAEFDKEATEVLI